MSDPSRKCLRCGTPLPPNYRAERPCPRCLMGLGLRHETGFTPRPGAAPHEDVDAIAELSALLPQFAIEGVVGEGGMGVVYRALHRKLDRLVALKVLRRSTGSDPAFGERFEREARALASLSHPNIVAIHDYGRAGDEFYLVMEFVDGTTLRELIDRGGVPPTKALAIVSDLSSALQYAHDAGIVHRDVKPENVLIDRDGAVKIADFGLARVLRSEVSDLRLTHTHQAMGTPHYMAPEQIERPLEVDHRADLYSLGVVFYELLTGELPIGRFDAPSRKASIDARLDDVVLRSLEKEPARRYQHASDVANDIRGIQSSRHDPGGETGERERRGETPSPPVKRRGKRWSWVWILVVTLLLTCLPITCMFTLMGVRSASFEPAPAAADEPPSPSVPSSGDAQSEPSGS